MAAVEGGGAAGARGAAVVEAGASRPQWLVAAAGVPLESGEMWRRRESRVEEDMNSTFVLGHGWEARRRDGGVGVDEMDDILSTRST